MLGQALRGCATAVLAAGVLAVVAMPAVQAQSPRQEQAAAHDFEIPAGPLSAALLRFGAQAGLQFNVDSRLTDGRQSGGVHGRHSVENALAQLLSGSGLTYRFAGPRSVVIEALPETGDARVLGPVRIEGAEQGSATNGVNGSSDITATEGSGSYTSGALSIAGKSPLSIKDTPASVSVVTRQRLDEQNITDFASLMEEAPGISTITGTNGALESEYYARGFRIERLQIDGGAPIDIGSSNWSLLPQIDTALYDHAEILRGADGLFNAYGSPGGVISLVRKRPLDHFQAELELQAGSWNNYRSSLDVTAPLTADGRLRGRGVLVWQDQDFFYDLAHSTKKIAYGVLDYDLTPATVVGLGASRTWQDALPFTSGLPRYRSGADLNLPRSTSFAFPWNDYALDTTEVFGWLEHKFNDSWNLKFNTARIKQDRASVYGSVSGAVNPVTLAGPRQVQEREDKVSTQLTADLALNGSFELFGHTQRLTVGGNYARADGGGYTMYVPPSLSSVAVNVFDFDPYDAAYAMGDAAVPQQTYPVDLRRQTNAYANLSLTFWAPLHLNIGLRYSTYRNRSVRQTLCWQSSGCEDLQSDGVQRAFGEVTGTYPSAWSTSDFSWPPTVSLVYDVTDAVSAYVAYSDIYIEQSTFIGRDGSPVDPITGNNIEAGVKWAARDGRLNLTLSGYRIEQKNFGMIDGSYANAEDYFQVDSEHWCCYTTDTDMQRISRGIDAEVTGEILPGWQIAASYTRNYNEETGSESFVEGQPLQSRLPKHLLKLWTGYQFQDGGWLGRLSVGGGVNAQTRGYYAGTACLGYNQATGACSGGFADFEFAQGTYAVFGARVAYQVTPRWQLALNVDNLFDRRYYQTVGNTFSGNWYGEPRRYALILRGRF
ncbi:MAG: TonB-dependent siderophore receptor [Pseudomonas sp.]